MKKIITIDCDNVLSDSTRTFLDRYAYKFGVTFPYEKMNKPYIHEIEELTHFNKENPLSTYIEFFDRAHDTGSMKVLDGAIQGVQLLHDRGYELHVVTGRGDSQKEVTNKWIEQHFLGYFKAIHYTNDLTAKHRPKGEIYQELGAFVHFDDFYHYAESIATAGGKVYLFDTPWNQRAVDISGIERVQGRRGAIELL